MECTWLHDWLLKPHSDKLVNLQIKLELIIIDLHNYSCLQSPSFILSLLTNKQVICFTSGSQVIDLMMAHKMLSYTMSNFFSFQRIACVTLWKIKSKTVWSVVCIHRSTRKVCVCVCLSFFSLKCTMPTCLWLQFIHWTNIIE